MPPPRAFLPARRNTSTIASGSFAWYSVGQGSAVSPRTHSCRVVAPDKAALPDTLANPFKFAGLERKASPGFDMTGCAPYRELAHDDQNELPDESTLAADVRFAEKSRPLFGKAARVNPAAS